MYFSPRPSEPDENPGRYRMENTVMEMNTALEFVGDNSRYQKRCLFLLSMQWLIYSFIVFMIPLFLPSPFGYKCQKTIFSDESGLGGTNETGPIGTNQTEKLVYNCTMEEACKGNNFYSPEYTIDSSISEDFSLYCEKVYLIGLMQTIYFSSKQSLTYSSFDF